MPQIKGTATWLTNVKREVPSENVGIDESDAKIENERIEADLCNNINSLQMKKHRWRADQEFELRMARREAEKWKRMQELVGKNHVLEVMDRRQEHKSDFSAITTVDKANHHVSFRKGQRIPRSKTALEKTNRFSSFIDSDSDDDINYGSKRSPSRYLSTTNRAQGHSSKKKSRGFSANEITVSNGRPKTSVPKGRSKSHPLSRRNKTRPKSSLGFSSITPNVGSHDSTGNGTHERSFQELKDLTHIDKITESIKSAKHVEHVRKKELERQEEKDVLQRKIQQFYNDVDEFKKKTKEDTEGPEWRKQVFHAW